MNFRNSTWFPEGRFSGHKRLPASLRGIFMANRDYNDPRTPRDIRETLRKPRSQVPRSPPAIGLRSGTASQQSCAGQKAHRNGHYNAQRSNWRTGTINSTTSVQTGQNRLSRRRVTRTSAKPSPKPRLNPRSHDSTPSHGLVASSRGYSPWPAAPRALIFPPPPI
ncbi:hypothetical protein CRG98_036382 [Punica granatum]|uniref:Uncharacterized protein n=1 Tax=Punica granatum TaxID=22663 RepID=A0A2I0IGU1_PUNGR|nr:hypothetical protein CRG98_036382 [Punica granatum]